MNVNQYALVSLEINKEHFKFQLNLPQGATWELCEQTIDEFKSAVLEMKARALAQAEAQAQSSETKE